MPIDTNDELRRRLLAELRNVPLTTPTGDPNAMTPNMRPTRQPIAIEGALASPTPTAPSRNFNFPQPTSPEVDLSVGGPPPQQLPPPAETPIRVGFGTKGLGGLEKIQARREALQTSDPESEIKVTPDFVEVGPPAMKGVNQKGRFRSALETGLSAAAHVDPEMLRTNPLYALGQAIGGTVGGAVSPRTGAKVRRHFDILDAQTDEARGLKLAQEGAQLDRQRLDPILRERELNEDIRINNERLELERAKAAKAIDDETYNREKDRLDRESREKLGREANVSREKAARIRAANTGAGNPQKVAENAAKREAKLNESSALYKKADNLDENAKKLEESLIPRDEKGQPQLDAKGEQKLFDLSGNEITDGYERQQETARRKKQVDDMRNEARGLRTKGDAARADGEAIPEAAPAQRWSASRWAKANPNEDVEAAKAAAKAAGYEVVE